MAATAASPPLPPRPPAARKALREKGEGGALTDVRLFSVAFVASPALLAPAGGSSARAHALCARAFRPSLRRALPRPHLAGSQLVLGARGRARELDRRRRGVAELRVRLCLPACSLDFRIRLPFASSLVAHCSPLPVRMSVACDRAVLLELRLWGAGTHRSRTVIQALRVHPSPLPATRRWRRIWGGKVNPLKWTVILVASWASGPSSAHCRRTVLGRGKHKGDPGPSGLVILTRRPIFHHPRSPSAPSGPHADPHRSS